MGSYGKHVLPHVITLSMCNRELKPYRERVISHAEGRATDVGSGSGFNLPFYE